MSTSADHRPTTKIAMANVLLNSTAASFIQVVAMQRAIAQQKVAVKGFLNLRNEAVSDALLSDKRFEGLEIVVGSHSKWRFPWPISIVAQRVVNAVVSLGAVFNVRRWRPTVLYTRQYTIALWAILLGIDTVLEVHSFARTFHSSYYAFILKRIIRNRKLLCAVPISHNVKFDMIAGGINPSKLHPLPNSAANLPEHNCSRREARQRLGLDLDSKLVVYTGRLNLGTTGDKGVADIISAAQLATNPNLQFILVGARQDELDYYESEVSRRHTDNIQIVPEVAHEAAVLYQRAADVLVSPAAFAVYQSQLKIVEYIFARRPMVCSSSGAAQWDLQDGKHLLIYEPGDGASLLGCVERLLQDPEMGHELADNAHAVWGGWDWSARAKELISIIHRSTGTQRK